MFQISSLPLTHTTAQERSSESYLPWHRDFLKPSMSISTCLTLKRPNIVHDNMLPWAKACQNKNIMAKFAVSSCETFSMLDIFDSCITDRIPAAWPTRCTSGQSKVVGRKENLRRQSASNGRRHQCCPAQISVRSRLQQAQPHFLGRHRPQIVWPSKTRSIFTLWLNVWLPGGLTQCSFKSYTRIHSRRLCSTSRRPLQAGLDKLHHSTKSK